MSCRTISMSTHRSAGSTTCCFDPRFETPIAVLLSRAGPTDALHALHPGERIYTFWKYFRNAFARNAGLRINHLLLSPTAPAAWSPPRSIWIFEAAKGQAITRWLDRT